MSDLTSYYEWQITRGRTLYGTPGSMLRRHAEHLRYWADRADPAMRQALLDLADELCMVRDWAEQHVPPAPPVPEQSHYFSRASARTD